MKLATMRIAAAGRGTSAARVEDDHVVILEDYADVGALLATPGWRTVAATAGHLAVPLADVSPSAWAPTVPRPSKILCVGLNYRAHILEMGRELPEFPTLFAKYPEALIGPHDPLTLPHVSNQHVDWEGELAVIIGETVRHASEATAQEAIAGYSLINDVTIRDYQYRTSQWLQGKTFEATSPLGPLLVTSDEFDGVGELSTEVNGEVVQRSSTSDLLFSPAALVSYVSQILTLNPGDIIASGTPGGVGHARDPQRYLAAGDTLTTTLGGVGSMHNAVVLG